MNYDNNFCRQRLGFRPGMGNLFVVKSNIFQRIIPGQKENLNIYMTNNLPIYQ